MTLEAVPGDARWGSGRSSRSSGYRSRTYYLPDELHFRMRNAWWHTQTQPGGHDSISELVGFALLPVVEELERRYHEGLPFPEIPERRRPKAGPSGRARQAHALRLQAAMRREGLLDDGDGDEHHDDEYHGHEHHGHEHHGHERHGHERHGHEHQVDAGHVAPDADGVAQGTERG